jgi:hypothetical protein
MFRLFDQMVLVIIIWVSPTRDISNGWVVWAISLVSAVVHTSAYKLDS